MVRLFASSIAAASLLILPALAQTDNAGNNSSSSNNSSSKSLPNAAQIQQDLHQDLSKAGYTDIQIVPGSFLVHAKNSKGEPTVMMVSPNSVTGITKINPSGSNQTNSQASK